MKLIVIAILSLFSLTSSAQTKFFKSLPKLTTDSIYSSFRPIASIAGYSLPNGMLMAGVGISYQRIDYNSVTQISTVKYSINGIAFAGGSVIPHTISDVMEYGLGVGLLNNKIIFGPAVNANGKFQGFIAYGITFN